MVGDMTKVFRALAAPTQDAILLALLLVAAWSQAGSFDIPSAALLVSVVGSWLPLLARRRWPVAALVGAFVAEAAHLVLLPAPAVLPDDGGLGVFLPVPLATVVTAYAVATRLPGKQAWGLGGAAAVLLFALAVLGDPKNLWPVGLNMLYLVLAGLGAGTGIRARRERLARLRREREDDRQKTVVDERLRIARELHDVVAHKLALVNAQAGVAEYLLDVDLALARDALRDIGTHTAGALDELRSTIGLLRNDADAIPSPDRNPVPGVDDIDELVQSHVAAGATVDVIVRGTYQALSRQADLAAYRIVQESLTNATKHAPGAPVRVQLTWAEHWLDLRVTNPGTPGGTAPGPGTGHGVIGMEERAAAVGGLVAAEPTPSGGFVVHAHLPTEAAHASRPETEPTMGI
jgi:signal transduction histidine kinase